jgi:hypothetical protein
MWSDTVHVIAKGSGLKKYRVNIVHIVRLLTLNYVYWTGEIAYDLGEIK